jgi:serine/threonine protein kinase/tetratricopeptide (TPR) repeat protein
MALFDHLGWTGLIIDGKFAVEALAGEGGFGVVYRGTHLALGAPVAIKCLKLPPHLDEPDRQSFLKAFQREARLLHRLSTRTTGIVQALDLGAATSPRGIWTPYAVMEWLEGETLEARLARQPSGLSLDEAIELLMPVARALAVAHEEGVSHRDIKPSNIFLVRGRRGVVTKILDFGLAEVITEATTRRPARLDEGGLQAFTPYYAAPEQFDARRGPTGPWTDVYALALMLIEAASGTRALAGNDVLQLFAASCDETSRPSLRARRPETPPAVEKVIQRAVAVNPKHRFRTAGEMWDALQSARGVPALTHDRSPSLAPAWTGGPDADPQGVTPIATGENRICTVVSIDLAEIAALSRHLDPGEVKAVLDRCLAVISEPIEAMRGYIDKHGADGAIGVFGALPASDGNAERAVHAALRVKEAIGKIPLPRSARSPRPATRIGISTGRVFTEGAAGATNKGFSVVGEAVTTALRLRRAAPPSAIVVDRDTCRQIAGRFNLEALPPLNEAGQSEQAFRVTGPVGSRHALPSHVFCGLDTRLVGRLAERQRLQDLLEAVLEERRATLVTLVGPSGIGRSRLLVELVSGLALDPRPVILVTVQGSALTADTSYGLAASAIRRRFDISEADPPSAILRRLRGGVRWLRGRLAREPACDGLAAPLPGVDGDLTKEDLDDALAQVASLLGPAKGRPGIGSALPSDDRGAQAKHRIAAAVARLVRFAASLSPVILLVDDAQWADDASLDLLDDLVLRVEDLPVLVVCSTRPDLYERRPHWGEGKAAHQRIDLGPLTRRHVEEMIRDRLRRARDLSPDFVRTLADRAEGNPLILDEIMHLLLDVGVIEAQRDVWSVCEDRLGELTLPATIQGIVQARLDRLDALQRATLGRAAVVGRTFWEGAVERLEPVDEPWASQATTTQRLIGLRERQFVRLREATTFQGEREWVFAESATQEVAYEMLPARQRRPLHLRVAAWLTERAGGGAVSALVALQADRGGDLGTAAAEYARAAAQASSVGQNAEARRLLLRARAIHDETEAGDGLSREAGEPFEEARVASWQERVRLRIDLGDVLRRAGQIEEAEAAYEQARARILRVERRRDGALDPQEATRWDARVDFRLSLTHKERGSNAPAQEFVARAILRAREAGIAEEVPEMYALLALLHRRARRLAESRKAVLRGLRVCQAIPAYDERRRDGAARLLLALAPVLYTSGRFVAAERTYRQVSRIATESGNQDVLGRALNGVAAALLAQGAAARARATFMQALRVKERAGDLYQLAVAYSNLAEQENKTGDYAAALEHARRGVRLAEQIRARSDLAEMYRNVAEASLGLGQIGEALSAGLEALAIAEEAGRLYLDDVALGLAKACARAAGEAPSGSPLRDRAVEAAKALAVALDRSFTDGALRQRAEECRAMIGMLLADAPAQASS